MFIDTHCHLDFPAFRDDRDEAIRRSREAGVTRLVNVGSSVPASRDVVSLAAQHDCVYAAAGCHPHEADGSWETAAGELTPLFAAPKVVALGEIGLDFFRNHSRRDTQEKLFVSLLKLAKERDLPVILHCRQAEEELLRLVRPVLPLRAVVHCFSGTEAFLKECLGLGFFVSFTCNITYPKAAALRELVRQVPLERMFLETDAPFLPPEGMRGQRNEPAAVVRLAEAVAAIKGTTIQEVARMTTVGAEAFFGL